MAWKFLTFFWENRLEFIERSKIIEIWWIILLGQVKISNLPAKPCAFGPKVKRILKNFKKILIKISMENWLFSQFFTKYFLDFWLHSETIDLWKITPDFYNNFSDFGGGGTFRRSLPPDATDSTQPPHAARISMYEHSFNTYMYIEGLGLQFLVQENLSH